MRPAPIILALLVLLAGIAACSKSNNLVLGRVQANVGTHLVVVTDCYRTSVPPPETKVEANGQTTYRFMPCKDAEIVINGDQLTVNGRSYGRIGPTDGVLVDHGVVSVTKATG
jgi:hypothetical protein